MVYTKYRVLKDDKIEFIGNAKQIKEKYGLSKTASLTYYAFTGSRIRGIYRVQFDEQENHLEWQTRMLDWHGNTVDASIDIKENLAELRELGYVCEAREFYLTDGSKKRKKSYVITLKGKKCTTR